ncbi:MAG: tetratricopeptide repeat protein [Chthoniobacterales bacterium]|nr:tetratricopeptide repeat protein [Chthoniobacterales bacterium]
MKRLAAALVLFAAASVAAQETGNAVLQQQRLAMVLRETTKLYEAGQYQAALQRLDTVQGAAAKDLAVLNLRGAILSKTGDYSQAGELFRSILAANPDYFPAAFNLGELLFMQGQYEPALESFQTMLARDPRNELLRFKTALCQLVLNRDEDAKKTAAGLVPTGSTPAWYYAQAVFARKAGDESRARKNLSAAKSIYRDSGCQLFDESIATVKF